MITDALLEGLEFVSAKWSLYNGSAWVDQGPITPNENSGFVIGDINSRVMLTIVSKVTNLGEYLVAPKKFSNSASASWNIEGSTSNFGAKTGGVVVEIGYNSISKKAINQDNLSPYITWEVSVDTRGQSIPEPIVYDAIFYYGRENSSNYTVEGTDITVGMGGDV